MELNRGHLIVGLTAAGTRALAQTSERKPAILGGAPVPKARFPSWPVEDSSEEEALVGVLRTGKWGRLNGTEVDRFEQRT